MINGNNTRTSPKTLARKIARKMIHEWGMGQKLYYEPDQRDAEAEINRLLDAADRQALEIIQHQKEPTDKLAQALLARETLSREEVFELLNLTAEPQPAGLPAPVMAIA